MAKRKPDINHRCLNFWTLCLIFADISSQGDIFQFQIKELERLNVLLRNKHKTPYSTVHKLCPSRMQTTANAVVVPHKLLCKI